MTQQRQATRASEKIQRRREERRARLSQKRHSGNVAYRWGIAAAVAFAVLLGGWWFTSSSATAVAGVQTLPDQGREHIQPGTAHPQYNSSPPTSGWHYPTWETKTGLLRTQVPDEIQVHNLEHGDIMIQYNCDCPDLVSRLDSKFGRERQVLIAPNSKMDGKLVLTAWTKLLKLEDYDEAKIRGFIDAFRNKGPERLAENS